MLGWAARSVPRTIATLSATQLCFEDKARRQDAGRQRGRWSKSRVMDNEDGYREEGLRRQDAAAAVDNCTHPGKGLERMAYPLLGGRSATHHRRSGWMGWSWLAAGTLWNTKSGTRTRYAALSSTMQDWQYL